MEQISGTITDLVVTFSECLRAVTPYVSKVGITWRDGESYDDWDAITQTFFATVVGGTISHSVEGEGFAKLATYGMMMPEYGELSFVFSLALGAEVPFLKLEASIAPFDTAVFLELDHANKPTGAMLKRPLIDVQLGAVLRSRNERRQITSVKK